MRAGGMSEGRRGRKRRARDRASDDPGRDLRSRGVGWRKPAWWWGVGQGEQAEGVVWFITGGRDSSDGGGDDGDDDGGGDEEEADDDGGDKEEVDDGGNCGRDEVFGLAGEIGRGVFFCGLLSQP